MSTLHFLVLYGSFILASSFRSKVASHVAVEGAAAKSDSEQERWGVDFTCSDIIPGAARRSLSWLRKDDCMCPHNWVISGSSPACVPYEGSRYFSLDRAFEECNCKSEGEVEEFVPIDHQQPKITPQCGVEYGYTDEHISNGMQDFLDNAYEWCNSKLVPKEKRVPAALRGLYWMKDLKLDDVAFCPSLAEWDEKTLTARMSVWNMFVFGKKKEEAVSHLAETAASIPVFGKPLVYSIQFTNSSMLEASITTNVGLANTLINFPMWAVDETPDGTVQKEKEGDIWYRWSAIAGFETGTYWAVRILDDDGIKNLDRYELMKESERLKNTTFQRFKTVCHPSASSFVEAQEKWPLDDMFDVRCPDGHPAKWCPNQYRCVMTGNGCQAKSPF